MDEDTAFQSAICQYFLWKAAQLQGQESSVTPGRSAALVPEASQQCNNTSNESSTSPAGARKAAPDETSMEKDRDKKMPAKSSTTHTAAAVAAATADNETNKFAQIAELMQQQTPALRALRWQMTTDTQPYIIARFSMFPQLHQDLLNERAQNQILFRQVNDLQIALAQAVHSPVGGGTDASAAGPLRAGKRASPPAPTMANGVGFELATPIPPAKKARKVDPNQPIKTNMSIASRADVPEDVKQLVSIVRKDLTKGRQKIKKLQTRVEKAEASAEKAKAPPPHPPPPTVAPQPATDPAPKFFVFRPPPVSWDERIKELEYFSKGNGHCRVPWSSSGLGRWAADLRKEYRKLESLSESERKEQLDRIPNRPYDLTHQRMVVLNEMGFDLNPAPRSQPFDVRYQHLVEFKEKHGHLRIRKVCNDPPGIGEFVAQLRKKYKKKDKTLMGERVEKLNKIGFIWDMNQYKPSFEQRLEECRDFRRKQGHLKVPLPPLPHDNKKNENEDGGKSSDGPEAEPPEQQENEGPIDKEKSFLAWAQRQRVHYVLFQQGKKSCLDKTRVRKLNEIGFDWTPQRRQVSRVGRPKGTGFRGRVKDEKTYNAQLDKLKHVQATYGDVNDINNVKAAFPGDDSLVHWIKHQRKHYKNKLLGNWHALTPERQSALEDLGFDFQPRRNFAPWGSLKKAAAATNDLPSPAWSP